MMCRENTNPDKWTPERGNDPPKTENTRIPNKKILRQKHPIIHRNLSIKIQPHQKPNPAMIQYFSKLVRSVLSVSIFPLVNWFVFYSRKQKKIIPKESGKSPSISYFFHFHVVPVSLSLSIFFLPVCICICASIQTSDMQNPTAENQSIHTFEPAEGTLLQIP